MIRVKTFLKYACIQLDEAKTAFKAEEWNIFYPLCSALSISLIKTIESTFSIKKGRLSQDRKALLRAVRDISMDEKEASAIVEGLWLLLEGGKKVQSDNKQEAKTILSKGEEVYNTIRRLCLP